MVGRDGISLKGGDYDYNHDPEHEDHQGDPGWRNTECGEAFGTNAKGKRVPRQIPSKEIDGAHSGEHIQRLMLSSVFPDEYVGKDIDDMYSAVREATRTGGKNARSVFPKINDYVLGFADRRKSSVEVPFSSLVENFFDLPADHRTVGKNSPTHTEKELSDFGEYIKFEQDVIRASGIVNSDDTVTLFRNTDFHQLPGLFSGGKCGDILRYKGNNLESWSTNPCYETKENWDSFPQRTKVIARIPLECCIASCIGREGGRKGLMMKGKRENEVMVCGAYLESVRIVGAGHEVLLEGCQEKYLSELAKNLEAYIARHNGGGKGRRLSSESAVFWTRRPVSKELLELARQLSSEKF